MSVLLRESYSERHGISAYPGNRFRSSPYSLETATISAGGPGVYDRASSAAGDFSRVIPNLLTPSSSKVVIHDWNDEAVRYPPDCLRACRKWNFAAGGTNDARIARHQLQGRSQAMATLNQLRGPGGLERTDSSTPAN